MKEVPEEYLRMLREDINETKALLRYKQRARDNILLGIKIGDDVDMDFGERAVLMSDEEKSQELAQLYAKAGEIENSFLFFERAEEDFKALYDTGIKNEEELNKFEEDMNSQKDILYMAIEYPVTYSEIVELLDLRVAMKRHASNEDFKNAIVVRDKIDFITEDFSKRKDEMKNNPEAPSKKYLIKEKEIEERLLERQNNRTEDLFDILIEATYDYADYVKENADEAIEIHETAKKSEWMEKADEERQKIEDSAVWKNKYQPRLLDYAHELGFKTINELKDSEDRFKKYKYRKFEKKNWDDCSKEFIDMLLNDLI